MFRDIQAILEKLLHLAGGELRRRQADVMHHQQRNFACGSLVEVGRRAMTNTLAPTADGVQLHTGSLSVTNCDQYAAFSPVVAITCRDCIDSGYPSPSTADDRTRGNSPEYAARHD